MTEQIISAELHRDDDGAVTSILFNGVRYEPVAEPAEAATPPTYAPATLGGSFQTTYQDGYDSGVFGFRSTA